MSRRAFVNAGAVLAIALSVLAGGCQCTSFGHSVDDEFGCATDADCPAGRACLADPASGELLCVVVTAGTDAGEDSGLGSDAGSDSGSDAAADSGPSCGPGDPCDDGLFCTTGETCDATGACGGGVPLVCDDGDACTDDLCDEATDACVATDAPDGTLCPAPAACFAGGECMAGICEPATPAPAGTGCDDADACTATDACDGAGGCAGAPVVCDDTNECTSDSCAPATGCVFTPVPAATLCDDGLFCTVSDACAGGVCGGAARDCSASGDQCNTGTCDETADGCVAVPVVNGTPCDDGAFCSTGEACSAGACTGGAPTDCSAAGDACNTGTCNEAANACQPVALPNGTPCDDGLFCNDGEACAAGVCAGGAPRPCSDGNGCTADGCDETANVCTNPNAPDGTPCDDGLFCTTGDGCSGGTCGGATRDCADLAFCTADSCNEAGDSCVNDPAPMNGLACDDGLFCSDPDTCAAGGCSGPARSCADTTACTVDSCDEAGDACLNDPLPVNGDPCDDGLFCTTADTCAAGACVGTARDCSDPEFCTADSCDEAGDTCVNDDLPMNGVACDDGLFCNVGETCAAGSCGGGGARDCDDTLFCTADACDEASDACLNDAVAMNGTACDDALFCTTPDACAAGACTGPARVCSDGVFCDGLETCDEGADACVSGTPPCTADLFTCTITCDEPTDTCNQRNETACGALQICDPIEYSGGATGCGAVPTSLTLDCPATATSGVTGTTCTLLLAGPAGGIDGEAGRIACTAGSSPVTMFADDFNDGSLDAPWTITSGSADTDGTPGSVAAVADFADWEADVTLSAAGLSVVCVDFDVAQENAGAAERIRWDVAFDGGTFATVFDLDFSTWEATNQTAAYNRNVCVSVPAGASTVTWRMRLNSGAERVWVDNVVMTGVGAAFTSPTNGGPDDMSTAAGWTFSGGSSPYVGAFGSQGNSMFANQEAFTATRGTIDATACDVLDVDFDFGFAGSLDTGDDVRLEVSVDGGPFTTVEFVNLANGVWNVDSALLPWFGLRRVTAALPSAAGASSVVFRFTLRSDDVGDRVWVDNFAVRCADLPDPITGTVAGTGGGGAYTVSLSSPVPEGVELECVWATTNDGPLVASDTTAFYP